MAQSNANLASELRHLRFRPQLNRKSKEETGDMKSLVERQQGMLQKRSSDLKKQRDERLKEESKDCTWTPVLPGAERGEKILQMAEKRLGEKAKGTLTSTSQKTRANFRLNWEKEKEERRLKREQIINELEGAELSFVPHLNRRSLMLVKKMKDEERYIVDKETGQTIRTPRKHAQKMAKQLLLNKMLEQMLGHEEETFHPAINSRTIASSGVKVHKRLYDSAVKKNIQKHNEQIDLRRKLLKELPEKAWEKEKIDDSGVASWMRKSMKPVDGEGKVRSFSTEDLVESEEKNFVNVLKYNTKFDFILEKIQSNVK